MTISSTIRVAGPYAGNGSQQIFTFAFKVFVNTDMLVVLTDNATGAVTIQNLTSNYTVSLNADQNANPGGTITMLVAPPAGVSLSITSQVPLLQPTDLANVGNFYPRAVTDALDRTTIQIQQQTGLVGSSVRGVLGESLSTLPPAATRAGNVLGFDAQGQPVLMLPPSGSGTALAIDLGNPSDPLKGITLVAGAGRVVDTIAALRALPKNGTGRVFVNGYRALGDGGGGHYYYDSADIASADNGGSIIVATDNGRWKLAQTAPWSVRQFGAIGDGVADDTAAIQTAFNALASGTGQLYFPRGVYNYTKLTFDGAAGLNLVGEGAINATVLRCTSTVATDGVKLRSTFDCTASYITFDHSSAAFTGYLVECNHKPSSGVDTQGMYFSRCTFASQGFNKYSANGVNLDQVTLVTFEGCKFGSLFRPVDGQNAAGGSYSNGVRFKNCQAFDNVGYFANYLGQQWTFQDCNFQACHDGANRIAFSGAATTFHNLVFINNGVYDATLSGTSYLNLGPGQGLTVVGGLWGGRSDLGSSTFLNATGIISGVSIQGAWFSLFTNVFVAGVAGNLGWTLGGGNNFVSCTNIMSGAANVANLTLDGNSPNTSLGTLPVTNGAASVRYNQDGSIEMTGAVSATAGGSTSVSFPQNFPTACWDVQLTLRGPAATSNVVSLNAAPTASGFQCYVNGTGANVVAYRAVGK